MDFDTTNIFDFIDGFNEREPWGEHHKVNGLLILLLGAVRKVFREFDPNCHFVLHCAYQGA